MVTSLFVFLDDFTWIHGIKVALGFARLLEFLHDKGLWVHNITPDHLLVDQAFSLKLFDFGVLVGGVFGEISYHKHEGGSAGYIDLHGVEIGDQSDKRDVFSYGSVLLGLIAKKVYDEEEHLRLGLKHLICFWAWVEYNKKPKSKFLLFRSKKDIKDLTLTYWGVYKERKSKSLVHESLKSDPSFDAGDRVEFTELAMHCVQRSLEQQPTMKEVVSCLKSLKCFGDVPLG
ncbi:probable serine/threonine-protein kinase PBL4 [Rhododendron vialii]|uniref:probable serine/threonine-protein kinase PBL4 n=1 Tax=Rhododendron vialii TaxID=182163 RepID=UPI00265E4E24|nr:probable serine/threonine-protein kinase PBL4 [Rhododendron vialii]